MSLRVSSLVVGDRVVSRCDDGLLEAEYALFDRSEVMLASGAGQGGGRGVVEEGYFTTAGFARARLYEALVTADLAHEAFAAMRGRHVRPLARSPAVAEILDQLGPYEAFQGGLFVAQRGRYAGLWLDLDTLAAACPLREAAILFQALHLILVLEEVHDDAPVRLLTASPDAEGRSGERTWRKVGLDGAQRLPVILREMQAPTRPYGAGRDEADVREEILRDLRARATAAALEQPRLTTLAAAIARTGWTPPAGMRAEATLAARRKSSKPPRPSSSRPPPSLRSPLPPPPEAAPAGQAPGDGTISASEENQGIRGALEDLDPATMFATLRDQVDRLRGEDHLRGVAQWLSSLVDNSPFIADLALLAARAWLAAGEPGFARHFARRVVDDADIADDLRIAALEILESVPKSGETARPPAAEIVEPSGVVVPPAEADRHVPPGGSLPPMRTASAEPSERFGAQPMTPPHPAESSMPLATPVAARPEIVETLALPDGLTEEILPAGTLPRDLAQVRVAMTRLARILGRDYRLTYGTTLKTDVLAVDAMQRHLRRRFADGPLDEKHTRQLQLELMRHGALLSEILARVLGARWADVSNEEPGRWAMWVPPGVTVWPIGRVYRFFGQGHREADLVAFFTELEAGACPRARGVFGE